MILTRSVVTHDSSQAPAVRAYGRGRQIELVLNERLSMGEIERGLTTYLDNTEGRLKGAEVTLNVGRRSISGERVEHLREILQGFQLFVSGVTCHPETLRRLFLGGKCPTSDSASRGDSTSTVVEHDSRWQETLLVKGTCRSGTVVHNDGNVVVLGDVNPGAEVTATQDVVVLGRLRGLAHAGMKGAQKSVIIAVEIDAPQLRIGPHMCVVDASAIRRRRESSCEMALIKHGLIVVEPFNPRSMPS